MSKPDLDMGAILQAALDAIPRAIPERYIALGECDCGSPDCPNMGVRKRYATREQAQHDCDRGNQMAREEGKTIDIFHVHPLH